MNLIYSNDKFVPLFQYFFFFFYLISLFCFIHSFAYNMCMQQIINFINIFLMRLNNNNNKIKAFLDIIHAIFAILCLKKKVYQVFTFDIRLKSQMFFVLFLLKFMLPRQ